MPPKNSINRATQPAPKEDNTTDPSLSEKNGSNGNAEASKSGALDDMSALSSGIDAILGHDGGDPTQSLRSAAETFKSLVDEGNCFDRRNYFSLMCIIHGILEKGADPNFPAVEEAPLHVICSSMSSGSPAGKVADGIASNIVRDLITHGAKVGKKTIDDALADKKYAVVLLLNLEATKIAMLEDPALFENPPPLPDCQICFLPFPERTRCTYQSCCGQSVCDGCCITHRDTSSEDTCPFCRSSFDGVTEAEHLKQTAERAEKTNPDPEALYTLGAFYMNGIRHVKKDLPKALELFGKAAEMGHPYALHALGMLFLKGEGVKRDIEKGYKHLRLAAIAGVLESREALAFLASHNGNYQLEMKHYILAASGGHAESMNRVLRIYRDGPGLHMLEKDVVAKTLRLHQSAVDAAKSPQREYAAKFYRENPDALSGGNRK